MEGLNKLENILLELLGVHNCVTIPGLGSFIYRESHASANHFTFEIRPQGNTIFFNNAIQADDGILANTLREQMGLSYSEALAFIKKCHDDILAELSQKKNLHFGKLGNFFLNSEGHVFFLPSGDLNLSREAYGLPVLKLDELHKAPAVSKPEIKTEVVAEPVSKTIPLQEQEFEEAEILYAEGSSTRNNRNWAWRVAAALAIVTMAGAAWYFGQQFFGRRISAKTQVANVDVPTKPVEEKTELKPTASDTVQVEPQSNTTEPAVKEESSTKITEQPNKVQEENKTVEAPTAPAEPIVSRENFMASLEARKGKYFIVGGTFMGEQLAKDECRRWNKAGVNATLYKPANSSLTRVILGRFETEDAASDFLKNMPGYHGSSVAIRYFAQFK